MKTNLDWLIENMTEHEQKNSSVCTLCYKLRYGRECDDIPIDCYDCEFNKPMCCCKFLKSEHSNKPILSKTEYDMINAYIEERGNGWKFDESYFLSAMKNKGYFKGIIDENMLLVDIIEKAIVLEYS